MCGGAAFGTPKLGFPRLDLGVGDELAVRAGTPGDTIMT